ncbi:MAG TPA: class I SAM-dependent methyltransferase [Methylocella sp.]|nr:class I SAM-dependent methyltransferase [Methylocella sp.]
MANIATKQAIEIDFWRDSKTESPQSNSIRNLTSKFSDAGIFLDCVEKYRDRLPEEGRVLELGGGQCWASCVYKRVFPNCSVIGTDISPFAVQSAPKWEKMLEVKLANAYACKSYEIEEDDASLDLIFCYSAAHHFLAHKRTLAEFKRVLKPGASTFYFFEPTSPSYLYSLAYKRVNRKRPEVPEDVLVPSKLRAIAGDLGLGFELDFYPSYKGRGATATAYYLILARVPFLQALLPCTANFIFTKRP